MELKLKAFFQIELAQLVLKCAVDGLFVFVKLPLALMTLLLDGDGGGCCMVLLMPAAAALQEASAGYSSTPSALIRYCDFIHMIADV